jgi:hypothetical protein
MLEGRHVFVLLSRLFRVSFAQGNFFAHRVALLLGKDSQKVAHNGRLEI